MILITMITPYGITLWIPNWLLALLLFALSYWSKNAEKRVTRKNTIVFERDTGKVYIPSYDDQPHQVLDFYDQYFYIVDGRVDVNRFGALYLYLPKGTLEDGREVGDFPIRLAFVGDREDAEEAWHFLVRYMDTSCLFDEEELEYFHYVQERKKREGFKVEDIRRVPGERVYF